jgi:hypothetical protein
VVLSDIPAHRNVIGTSDATGTVVPDDPVAIRAAVARYRDRSADLSLPNWREIAAAYLDHASVPENPIADSGTIPGADE